MANIKKKSSTVEIERRVGIIIALITSGVTSRRNIQQYIANKEKWDISNSQIDVYIKRATTFFTNMSQHDNAKEIGIAKGRFDDLYMKSLNISDYKTCLAIQKERNGLLGLNDQIQKIEISGNLDMVDMSKKTTEELRLLASKC